MSLPRRDIVPVDPAQNVQELEQAFQDAERRAQQSTPVFAGTSTQPYATRVQDFPLVRQPAT